VILVDTSVWIDHLRARDEILAALLDEGRVLSHPFVIGELALGRLRERAPVLINLGRLPAATVASDHEVLGFIDRHRLFGSGIGYIDAHLLASAHLTADATLWTRDRRLAAIAQRLHVAASLPN